MSASPTEGTDMNQIEKVARAIIGPHEPVPASSRYTLDELREVRWRQITSDERSMALREAKAAIAAMQPAPQWQGIESAPRDGTFVLGFGPHNTRGSYREVIHWWGDRWTLTWMEGYGEPTHWMPLPTPPAGGSDAE